MLSCLFLVILNVVNYMTVTMFAKLIFKENPHTDTLIKKERGGHMGVHMSTTHSLKEILFII